MTAAHQRNRKVQRNFFGTSPIRLCGIPGTTPCLRQLEGDAAFSILSLTETSSSIGFFLKKEPT
jgi:hypothetical protein